MHRIARLKVAGELAVYHVISKGKWGDGPSRFRPRINSGVGPLDLP
jgi:hypothetical protein